MVSHQWCPKIISHLLPVILMFFHKYLSTLSYYDQCLSFISTPLAVPKFTQEPSDVVVDIGSNVTLPCHAHGYPEPQITWRREDGSTLFTRPRLHGSISQRKGDLRIICKFISQQCTYVKYTLLTLLFLVVVSSLGGG